MIYTTVKSAVSGQLIVTPEVCDCEPAPLGCNFPYCKADKSTQPAAFDLILESVKQADAIIKGEAEPSRVFVVNPDECAHEFRHYTVGFNETGETHCRKCGLVAASKSSGDASPE